MGGPIDTRRSPTEVTTLAKRRGLDWFRRNVLHPVPFPYPGFGREVYPGFLQLSGFLAMNLERHVNAHLDMFNHLVEGDGDSAEKHRDFYDEYLAVMDLDAAYYMQTIEAVFFRHDLPKGKMKHRGQLVDLKAIRHCGLMTVEGEKDDIAGIGQTFAAQELCVNIPQAMRVHHLQLDVGHYGIFNGSRFRNVIAPKMRKFWADIDAMNGLERTNDVLRGPTFPPTDDTRKIYVRPTVQGSRRGRLARGIPLEILARDGRGEHSS